MSEYMPLWRLRRIIGEDAAQMLISDLGGTRVYAAAKPKVTSRVVLSIGMDLARKLGAAIVTFSSNRAEGGGDWIELPKPDHRHRDRLKYVEDNPQMTEAELAAALNASGRTIRRMRATLRDAKAA